MNKKCIDVDVILLDSSTRCFHLPPRSPGHELYTMVVEHLQLVEYDYFDLEYINKDGLHCWLDHSKAINKQINISKRFLYSFVVKFYTPHPNLLEDELTRYLFALQIKIDLRSGRLQCSESTAALLAAFIVQAKIGDFLEDLYQDHSYLFGLHLLNQPSDEMLKKIAECHRNLIGQSPAEADYNLLDTVRKIELYGIRINPAKDKNGLNVNIAVTHSGICVYQGGVRTNLFSWARIRKLSFKRKNFFIKIHPEGYDAIGFSFGTRNECKSFWKQCIEHHAFFRCQAVRNVGRKNRVVSKGSSFRYIGRTQKQLTDFIRENYIKMPNFERSSSTSRVLNTETSAILLSSLKLQNNAVGNCHDNQGNPTVHSDFGPSIRSDREDVVLHNRPQTDPSQRLHLTSNLLSSDLSNAVATPISGQSNSVGSVGSYQIIPENIQILKQRRSGSAAGQIIIADMDPHAHLFSTVGTASSGTYTINSSVSVGTPTGSASPTGSPHLEDKPATPVTSSDYAAQIVWPNKLSLRPLSVSNLALPRPSSAPQSGWRASLPRHVMQNTSGILIAQPNVTPTGSMNVAIIGTDPNSSVHTSLLLSSKNQFTPNQINPSQANNLQIGTTVTIPNVVMANNTILPSSLTPIRAICMPMQHQSVQLGQITSGSGNNTVPSQLKLPPGCAILTGSGQTPNITGRIIYVDRATGQSYIPVLTNASGNLNQVTLGNHIPLAIRQPQFAQVASPSTHMTSPTPLQQQQAQLNCAGTDETICSQSDNQITAQISTVQSNPSSIPPDVTRNIRTIGRRPGPPPPAPERRDSILQKNVETINQSCITEPTSLPPQIQPEKNSLLSSVIRDQSDSQGEEETSDSHQNSQNLKEQSHPLAMGIITGPSSLHLASCLSLATRERSALSMANLCVDRDGSDFDKVSDTEQNELGLIHQYPCINSLHRPRLLTSVSARVSDADITDDDHHSICSQRSSTARSVSNICRHGHRHHHRRHSHNHNNRQNRPRCFSAIDPYMIYNQNGDESDNQNYVNNKHDSYQADDQVNPHGVHSKPQTFRRLSKHHLDEAYHLVRELVMTERTYKRNLSVICTHFKDIGKDLLCSNLNINPQLLQELTSNLVDLLNPIYTEHCIILNNFENRLSNWSSQQNDHNKQSTGLDSLNLNSQSINSSTGYRIGDLFVASLHILPLYHCYLLNAGNIMLDIEKLTRIRPEIEQLLRNFEAQKYCYLPFYVFLLKPMHRLLQYRVLLERLMRYYGEIHPDLSDCRIAHAKLNDLIQSQWESYKKMENTYKLLEIQRDLIGFNPDIISSSDLSQYSHLQNERNNCNNNNNNDNKQTHNSTSTLTICGSHSLGPIYHPNRQFIREGWLQKLSKKGYQPRMFFLLSDQLIYASRTMTSYLQFKVHGQFSLQDLMVEEVEPAHSFTIYSGNRCFLVAASSDWQRDRWLEDISRAILAAKTRPSSSTSIMNESIMNNMENNTGTSMKTLNCNTFETDSTQMLQRAVTSVHVCWHRCFTLSMQDILRANEYQTSGYLLRKFKNSNGWQRLWVVFTQLCLFFYKSYRDECPLASLPLLGYIISKPGPEDQIRRDNVLKMQFKNHVYFFRGETRLSFERWVEYLSCAAGASRPLNISSTIK